jgi:hypothetical protein
MGRSITILAGHPYFECAKPFVMQLPWNSRWRVQWRDFHAMKQDVEFDTEKEAIQFAETLCKPPMTVYDYSDDLADCDRFWREMAEHIKPPF